MKSKKILHYIAIVALSLAMCIFIYEGIVGKEKDLKDFEINLRFAAPVFVFLTIALGEILNKFKKPFLKTWTPHICLVFFFLELLMSYRINGGYYYQELYDNRYFTATLLFALPLLTGFIILLCGKFGKTKFSYQTALLITKILFIVSCLYLTFNTLIKYADNVSDYDWTADVLPLPAIIYLIITTISTFFIESKNKKLFVKTPMRYITYWLICLGLMFCVYYSIEKLIRGDIEFGIIHLILPLAYIPYVVMSKKLEKKGNFFLKDLNLLVSFMWFLTISLIDVSIWYGKQTIFLDWFGIPFYAVGLALLLTGLLLITFSHFKVFKISPKTAIRVTRIVTGISTCFVTAGAGINLYYYIKETNLIYVFVCSIFALASFSLFIANFIKNTFVFNFAAGKNKTPTNLTKETPNLAEILLARENPTIEDLAYAKELLNKQQITSEEFEKYKEKYLKNN